MRRDAAAVLRFGGRDSLCSACRSRRKAASHRQRHKSSRHRRAAAPHRAAARRGVFPHRAGRRYGSPRRERCDALASRLVCRGALARRTGICSRHPRHARRRGIHERRRLRRGDEGCRHLRNVSRRRPFRPRDGRRRFFLPAQPLFRYRLHRSRRRSFAARGRSRRRP